MSNDVILNKIAIIERCIKNLKTMVGFRNIAFHNYQTVNLNIVKEIIEKHLKDLKSFGELVSNKIL